VQCHRGIELDSSFCVWHIPAEEEHDVIEELNATHSSFCVCNMLVYCITLYRRYHIISQNLLIRVRVDGSKKNRLLQTSSVMVNVQSSGSGSFNTFHSIEHPPLYVLKQKESLCSNSHPPPLQKLSGSTVISGVRSFNAMDAYPTPRSPQI
jgi:hypothetical protein